MKVRLAMRFDLSKLGGIEFSRGPGRRVVMAIVAVVVCTAFGLWPRSRGDIASQAKADLAAVYLGVCTTDEQRAAVTEAISSGHEAAFDNAYVRVSGSGYRGRRTYRLQMDQYAQALHPAVMDAAARVGPDEFVSACDAEYREFMREIKRPY